MASDFEAQVRATNDKINARTGRPLIRAIAVGLLLGGALLVSLVLVKELYMVFAAALIGFTSYELASALRFAGLNFVLGYLFLEVFTPINMLGDPLVLVLAELGCWAVIALAEACVIAALMERSASSRAQA